MATKEVHDARNTAFGNRRRDLRSRSGDLYYQHATRPCATRESVAVRWDRVDDPRFRLGSIAQMVAANSPGYSE